MRTLTVITCFTYLDNPKYSLNPNYLRSDLRRILAFSLNQIGCSLSNIYVITDIIPDVRIQDEIRHEFQEEVRDYLRKLGYQGKIKRDYEGQPISWLHQICHLASNELGISQGKLFNGIIRQLLPILRSSNIVEFTSLFTHFVQINGQKHYHATLRNIFTFFRSTNNTSSLVQNFSKMNLFFYYTGHGVRKISEQNGVDVVKDICLVIPGFEGTSESYSRTFLQKVFQELPSDISSFVVFDCCHSESLLKLPFKITLNEHGRDISSENLNPNISMPNMIYLASAQHNQTCGFYVNSEECGSVFTYYLMKCLAKLSQKPESRKFSIFYPEVEKKVNQYRVRVNRTPQNMLIRLSHYHTENLPAWLFRNRCSHLRSIQKE